MAPLDWGLGHATRCIPIIRSLLNMGHEVLLAANGRSYHLLKQEFPELAFLTLPEYQIRYPKNRRMVSKMMMQTPGIIRGMLREHRHLARCIKEHRIEGVISDNRYGLWSDQVPCVLMTHQLKIKMPEDFRWMQAPLYRLLRWIMAKYTFCWIPDYAGEPNLSGELSHEYSLPEHASFVGPLSRFSPVNNDAPGYELLILLSGPEPQRTLFEEILLDQLKPIDRRVLMVCGKTEQQEQQQVAPNVKLVSHLAARELNEAIAQAGLVIARSGYSTIMDLAALQKKAILVPTPGQTEQEYLAKRLKDLEICYTRDQGSFDLQKALSESVGYAGFGPFPAQELLAPHLQAFLEVC